MTGKTTFKQRLAASCARAGIKAAAPALIKRLADHAKAHRVTNPVKSRQTVYTWLKDEGKPQLEYLFFLAAALGVNPDWLATGNGEMAPDFALSTDEKNAVLQIYRPLKRSPKALNKWIKDGHELVEISTFASKENPFAKVE